MTLEAVPVVALRLPVLQRRHSKAQVWVTPPLQPANHSRGGNDFFFFSYPPSLIKASSLGCQATEQRDQLIPESVRICPTEKHQPVYSALTRTIKSLNFIGLARHRNQDFYMDPTRPFS